MLIWKVNRLNEWLHQHFSLQLRENLILMYAGHLNGILVSRQEFFLNQMIYFCILELAGQWPHWHLEQNFESTPGIWTQTVKLISLENSTRARIYLFEYCVIKAFERTKVTLPEFERCNFCVYLCEIICWVGVFLCFEKFWECICTRSF